MKVEKICKKTLEMKLPELLNSKQKVMLDIVITGQVIVTECGMENTESKKTEALPVYSYVVHHEKHGNFLIDAGLDESFIKKVYGSQKGLIRNLVANKAYQEEGQSIKSYLQDNNIELSGVFLSHLHFDHIAGLMDLHTVKTCTVGKGEKYNKFKPWYFGNQLKHINILQEIEFDDCKELEPLGRVVDFFDDGSFIIIETPGHTPGHISFLLNTREGNVFVCGDAYGYERESLIEKGPGSYSEDKEQGKLTLKKIIEFANMYPQVKIMTGHGE